MIDVVENPLVLMQGGFAIVKVNGGMEHGIKEKEQS